MTKVSQTNESTKFSFSNPFDAVFEQVKAAGETVQNDRKAKEAFAVYSDKPFAVEYASIYTLSKGVALAAGLVSFASAIFALQSVLFWVVGLYVSWAGAGVLCYAIEKLKTQVWEKVAKAHLKYKRFLAGGLGVLVGLHLLSLGTSLYGAFLIPAQFQPEPIRTDSTTEKAHGLVFEQVATIDKQISNLDAQIQAQTPLLVKPNGAKSSSTAKSLSALNTQKSELQKQKAGILEKVESVQKEYKEVSEKRAQTQNKEVEFLQYLCVGVAALFELIFVLCTLFSYYYLFRVYVESNPENREQTLTENREQALTENREQILTENREQILTENRDKNKERKEQQNPHIAPNPNANPAKIGFKWYDSNGGLVLPVCVNCGIEFLPNHHKQKYCKVECKEEYRIKSGKKPLPKFMQDAKK